MGLPTTLEYQGRELSADPTEINLVGVAERLNNGHPVSVTLEPGDATRYELLLVPMWALWIELDGWGPADRLNGLIVTRLGGGYPRGSMILLFNRSWHDYEPITNDNEWTTRLFGWWFDQLKDALQEVRNA